MILQPRVNKQLTVHADCLCADCLQPSVAAERVFTSPVSRVLAGCNCSSTAECFLYFTDLTCSAADAYLLLSKVSAAVGLQQATLTVQLYVFMLQVYHHCWLADRNGTRPVKNLLRKCMQKRFNSGKPGLT